MLEAESGASTQPAFYGAAGVRCHAVQVNVPSTTNGRVKYAETQFLRVHGISCTLSPLSCSSILLLTYSIAIPNA